MKKRKEILSNMFNSAVSAIRFKQYPKKSEKYEQNQKLIEAINDPFFNNAKIAVLEKWMTLCKNQFIDEIMQWRLRYLTCRFTPHE